MRQIVVAWTGGIPGFGDARVDGRYAVARPGLDVVTDDGLIAQPDGQPARYITLPPSGDRIGCTWTNGGPDRAKEWTGTTWSDRGLSCGTNAVIYDNAGTLVISQCSPPQGPLGWRYVDAANRLVTCESTYADPTKGTYEYTAWPDLRIGQGGKDIGQGAVVWFPDLGLRRLTFQQLRASGALRNIRARRTGNDFAITIVDYEQHLTTMTWATLAELRALAPVVVPLPVPPPTPPPPPVPVPPPVPTPPPSPPPAPPPPSPPVSPPMPTMDFDDSLDLVDEIAKLWQQWHPAHPGCPQAHLQCDWGQLHLWFWRATVEGWSREKCLRAFFAQEGQPIPEGLFPPQ